MTYKACPGFWAEMPQFQSQESQSNFQVTQNVIQKGLNTNPENTAKIVCKVVFEMIERLSWLGFYIF